MTVDVSSDLSLPDTDHQQTDGGSRWKPQRRCYRNAPTNATGSTGLTCVRPELAVVERIALCVSGFYGSAAVLVIVGLVALTRCGGVRLACAAVLRRWGLPLYRWLAKGRDHR